MLLSPESIGHLSGIITGSLGISPLRNEKEIIDLFKKYTLSESFDEFYSTQDAPADEEEKTSYYTEQKIKNIVGTSHLTDLVEQIFNSLSFFKDSRNKELTYSLEECVASFNTCMSYKDRHGLVRDNYAVTKAKTKYRVYSLDGCMVDYSCLFQEHMMGNHILINEHAAKCIKKVNQKDYSGAITSARSLLEQILREIEFKLEPTATAYNGKLSPLMKRTLKLVGLTSGNMPQDIQTIYSQILRGLNTTVDGIAGMRNNMGDAHPITYQPNKKEALLAVNASKTLANFLVEHYFEKYVVGQSVQ